MKTARAIVEYLDRELRIDSITESSHNGLQVENSGRIGKVCCGVDATLGFFKAAKKQGANFLVCHHGISWNDSLRRITCLNYKRLSFLIQNDIALYACHLPLDVHPRHGNNILICKALGLRHIRRFGTYRDTKIGFKGTLAKATNYETFKKRVARVTGGKLWTLDFGKKSVKSVAVVSGAAADELEGAFVQGIDVYVSGEPKLSAYHVAEELGINAVFAGHYATETFGVRAVARLLKQKFNMPAEFIDLGTPF